MRRAILRENEMKFGGWAGDGGRGKTKKERRNSIYGANLLLG